MGSRDGEADEKPVHRVVMPDYFYLGIDVVTQKQYAAVAQRIAKLKERADPSEIKGIHHPVENVDWWETDRFCQWLTQNIPASQLPPGGFNLFCLPTEAEWEYACRAGTATGTPK